MNTDFSTRPKRLFSFPQPLSTSILVLPLGGTDRVGMNATLVGHNGRWIMIDAGATFPGADNRRALELGAHHGGEIEQIVPDIRAIRSIIPLIDGIVFTHAHEDHIGALTAFYGFLEAWPELADVPLYATSYCAEIISNKLHEVSFAGDIRIIEEGVPARIGSFHITPVRVTHSAPQTQALAVKTLAGTIVFGSDMKLDPNPILGRPTDTETLERLGHEGVLATFFDSTNANRDGRSASEESVSLGIEKVMATHPGRVVISTFASNIARVLGVSRAAVSAGRYLAAAGRSLLTNTEAARRVGLIDDHELNFAENAFVMQQDPAYAAVICTGTQAEQGAALTRAVEDLELGKRYSRRLRLEPGDMVIHSARCIPGNEKSVHAMFHTMRRHGVTVLDADNGQHLIHASGHGKRGELIDFYEMLRPRFAVPVHGDKPLIDAHLDLVAERGIEGISPREGDILEVNSDGASIIGRIQVGQLATLTIGQRRDGHTRLIAWDGAKPIQIDRREFDDAPKSYDGTTQSLAPAS